MDVTEQTIEQLVAKIQPVSAVAVPWRLFLAWLLASLIVTLPLLLVSAHRADLAAQLHAPLFQAETATLVALILSCGLAAVWLCYPDLRQQPWVVALPLFWLLVFAGLCLYRFTHPALTTVLPEDAHNAFACVGCILLYAAAPGIWMFYSLRRYAPTHPMLAGGIAMLAAAGIGAIVLKFAEANDAVPHLLVWHVLPVLALTAAGSWLGLWLLRW